MAENEYPNRYGPSRRGYRSQRYPPMDPGVRKAVHNFGVRDLRDLLNKKHQDQGDDPTQHKENEPRSKGINPPPDPTYNFLKDSSRDQGKPPGARRNESSYGRPGHYDNFRRGKESPVSQSSGGDSDGPKKELRFSDSPRVGRGSFRGGRNANRKKEERIANPVNIKVELTEAGQRNCVLDENTKLPDIKHVPDKHYQSRGSYRSRGSFRGRGRGRGKFVRRRSDDKDEQKPDTGPEESASPEAKDDDENVDEAKRESDVEQEYQEEQDEGTEENLEGDEEDDNNGEHSGTIDPEISPSPVNADEAATVDKETSAGFDPNLKESITITSSKFQDSEVKREVKVEPVKE
ncbi:uncharacterized protein LOC143204445 [Rhynchophorus ferrugineus]|uniref:uncharacterized protein LOC143204445 n=1 Tax=Rhynchophorus ferrugineus TaxID=354439 RepID=UPI003FCCDCB2